ncbi:MAG: hypothetical protein QOH12_2990 [Solirubrobacteraceae bacterium]|nr:hypothetical protein [Solirubrobacteraceae bacterium]
MGWGNPAPHDKLLAGVLCGAALLIGLAGVMTGHPQALIVVVPAGLYLARLGLDVMVTRRAAESGGREDELLASHLEGDDGRPLGDSAELHDELSARDVPVDHPARAEAERRLSGPRGRGPAR